MLSLKKQIKKIKFVELFLILWRHKKKWFINNSKKLYGHAKKNNQSSLGIYFIYKMLWTELFFLKEKNESAKEYGYMLPNRAMSDSDVISKHYRGDYKFELMDAFSPNINMWSKFFLLNDLYAKKIKYLEIGVFEGRSSVYVLENLQNAICYFVDPLQPYDEMTDSTGQDDFNKIYDNFTANIKPFDSRATLYRKTSDSFFLNNTDKFDLIYIDGSHFGDDVYKDAINAFDSLNKKGFIIFDDFFWFFFDTVEENPLGGIFKFIVENNNHLKIKYVSNQLIIQKK